jgi:hypothetical protein
MMIPREALEFENRSLGGEGEPTLCSAYEVLLGAWRSGSRDREVGLHLMFLAWYLLCEPPHLTGLDERRVPSSTLSAVFHEVHEYFRPNIATDAEMLYVVGLMAHLFPYLLGEQSEFEALAREYRSLYRSLAPRGISPELFGGRGAYGEYFAGQSQVASGY